MKRTKDQYKALSQTDSWTDIKNILYLYLFIPLITTYNSNYNQQQQNKYIPEINEEVRRHKMRKTLHPFLNSMHRYLLCEVASVSADMCSCLSLFFFFFIGQFGLHLRCFIRKRFISFIIIVDFPFFCLFWGICDFSLNWVFYLILSDKSPVIHD